MNEINPNKLRNVAGSFATGITVVCSKKDDGEITGLTANSFLSVSLDPPLILFSIQNKGSFLKECAIGKKLGMSILSSKQKKISKQFAGQNRKDIHIDFQVIDTCPIINGALAWYWLEVEDIRAVGDHHLVTCRVLDLGKNNGSPLIYYSGYRLAGRMA